jgi:hypothetical protein
LEQEYILDPANLAYFRAAMNLAPPPTGKTTETLTAHAAWFMTRSVQLPKQKAIRFLTDLHTTCVPDWIQNNSLRVSDLVHTTKESYLNA